MKGPYTTVLRSGRDHLETSDAPGTLQTHINLASLRAAEWICAGVVDSVDLDTFDSKGTNVRFHLVCMRDEDGPRLANNLVVQRLS